MRVLLRVAYDGSAYCGYQIQDNGDTIQEELEKALLDLFCVPIETTGGSRTDAGVHSLGNPVVFDVETKMKAMSIAPALNVRLPEDIPLHRVRHMSIASGCREWKFRQRETVF